MKCLWSFSFRSRSLRENAWPSAVRDPESEQRQRRFEPMKTRGGDLSLEFVVCWKHTETEEQMLRVIARGIFSRISSSFIVHQA